MQTILSIQMQMSSQLQELTPDKEAHATNAATKSLHFELNTRIFDRIFITWLNFELSYFLQIFDSSREHAKFNNGRQEQTNENNFQRSLGLAF